MLTFLRGFLLLVLGIYAFVFLIAVFLSDRMIFQPHPSGYWDNAGIIKLRSRNGVRISARFLAKLTPVRPLQFLFSHGNAEDIGDDEAILEGLRAADLQFSRTTTKGTARVRARRPSAMPMKMSMRLTTIWYKPCASNRTESSRLAALLEVVQRLTWHSAVRWLDSFLRAHSRVPSEC